jgi:putative oxidoreductase
MKKLLCILFSSGNYTMPVSLSLLLIRFIVGAFMLTHGYGKLLSLLAEGPVQFADPIGMGETASLVLAVFAEFFCSLFLILGAGTRLSTIPLLVTMLVAVFVVHASDGFGRQELPLLYASIYGMIALAGAGKYSVDYWISGKLKAVKR